LAVSLPHKIDDFKEARMASLLEILGAG